MSETKELKYNEPWILQRADPYVYRHTDGMYYFTASLPEYNGIALRRASTLAGLADAEETMIWKKHDKGIMSVHIWAPELHYLDGKWYIYFAGGDIDDIWAIRPYVLECADADPITGTWVEKGKMQRSDDDEFSFEDFSLDATVFEHRGEHYYVWAEKVGVGKKISNLYIAKMQSPYKLKTAQVLLTTPDYDWERVGFWVNEGPFLLKHDGKLFFDVFRKRDRHRLLRRNVECRRGCRSSRIRLPGKNPAIRFFVLMRPEKFTDRVTIALSSLRTAVRI